MLHSMVSKESLEQVFADFTFMKHYVTLDTTRRERNEKRKV